MSGRWWVSWLNASDVWQHAIDDTDEVEAWMTAGQLTLGGAKRVVGWDYENSNWSFVDMSGGAGVIRSGPPSAPAESDWKSLSVDGNVPIKKDYWYRAAALVKTRWTKTDIVNKAKKYGLVITDYSEGPVSGSYRTVSLKGYATVDIPAGFPTSSWVPSFIDDSHATKVEYAAPGKPAIQTIQQDEFPWGWVLLGAGAAGAGYWIWRRKRKRKS